MRTDAAEIDEIGPALLEPAAAVQESLPAAPAPPFVLARMRFRGEWRDYQRQVLGDVQPHLTDSRLHVVAPPGAGKTILGLEIVRRLGRQTLVFAPTTAIRDQWADRISSLFLDAGTPAADISFKLAELRPVTLATYQALDAIRRTGELDRLVEQLKAAGPLTLVLDEAHHLRREWWTAVEQLAASLVGVRIVALTATPPYDATAAEWTRYERLCGPIDVEIAAPDLVRNGDLCPHQDHVILSEPTADVLALLEDRRRALWHLQRDLWADHELLDGLETHPWLKRPEAHVEEILEAPEMLSAVLILLAGAGRRPPAAPLRLLGVSPRDMPTTSFFWLERFLDGVTAGHAATFPIGTQKLRALRMRLHRHGLIEGGRVRLRETRSIFQLMACSLAKLDSIADIVRAEEAAVGDRLRLVVLSEHVRAHELPADPAAEFRPAKLGVAPIFEHLRRAGLGAGALGVLTGSLVIVPKAAVPALAALVAEHDIDASALRTINLPGCPEHVRVELTGAQAGRLVQLVTALFDRGVVRVLVGTQALLGEGWDAPPLNSLVLASNTASFMLSNQMRGRAIRTCPEAPGKVANIWHLATVAPPDKGLLAHGAARLDWGRLWEDGAPGLSDAALLARRFRAFEGISNSDSTSIECGVSRLSLDLSEVPLAANGRTFAIAADRLAIARRWARSLGAGAGRARMRETAAPNYAPRRLAWTDTLHALIWAAASAAAFGAAEELIGVDSLDGLAVVGMAAAGAAVLAGVPKLARAAYLLWRNGSVEGSLAQVGRVVLTALADAGLASEAEARTGRFEVRRSLDGRRDIALRGVSRSTERQVMQAIAEVLGPVQNARYLLVRTSRLGPRLRADYHAVPAALAARKAWAERFAQLWARQVGSSRLVYTRTPKGRRLLLRARAKSLSAAFQRSVDRRSAWL